jgi:LacI family transcriptional regulator
LRNAGGIHPETRSRIVKAAEDIGYELPHTRYEVALRPHQVMTLAQCISPVSDSKYLAGMSRASVSLNLSVLSHHVTIQDCADVLNRKLQPPAMRMGMVDGLVLIHRWPSDVARRLSEQWPTVSIVHYYPGTKMDHIGIDDRGGMSALLEHLYAAGHRKIGFFGYCRDMSWACARLAAYAEGLMRLDLPYVEANVIPVTLKAAMSPTIFATDGWSDTLSGRIREGVDAWICSSAIMGFTVCRYLNRKGIRLPEDVSLASYHGASVDPPADLPAITTTAIITETLGSSALQRLVHRFAHPEESSRSILIPAQLVTGETTRPALASGR